MQEVQYFARPHARLPLGFLPHTVQHCIVPVCFAHRPEGRNDFREKHAGKTRSKGITLKKTVLSGHRNLGQESWQAVCSGVQRCASRCEHGHHLASHNPSLFAHTQDISGFGKPLFDEPVHRSQRRTSRPLGLTDGRMSTRRDQQPTPELAAAYFADRLPPMSKIASSSASMNTETDFLNQKRSGEKTHVLMTGTKSLADCQKMRPVHHETFRPPVKKPWLLHHDTCDAAHLRLLETLSPFPAEELEFLMSPLAWPFSAST